MSIRTWVLLEYSFWVLTLGIARVQVLSTRTGVQFLQQNSYCTRTFLKVHIPHLTLALEDWVLDFTTGRSYVMWIEDSINFSQALKILFIFFTSNFKALLKF